MTDRAAVALPRRALAGSVAGKGLEALTLAGLVLLVPRALGASDYGAFAVALAVATAIATATGIGGPALFARVLAPLPAAERRSIALVLLGRIAVGRAALLAVLALAAGVAAVLAPGTVTALQAGLVGVAAVLGAAATLLAQLALGLEQTVAWSLRYPLENGVIVIGAVALYPVAGVNGAIVAIVVGAAFALGLGAAVAWPQLRGVRAAGAPLAERPAAGPRVREGRARGREGRARGREGRAARVQLPAGTLRFARMQAAGGALTQAVHRGAAPACALLGVTGVATGHAAIAVGAALAITYAVLQTTLVALPGAARAFERDPAAAEAALRRVAGWCALVVLPTCALLAVAAEELLAGGLGEEFRGAADPLRIALGAAALAPLWALATQLAALRGRPGAALAGAAAGAATFVVVAALAVPDGDARGAAAAMVAGVAATVAGTFAALRLPEGA